MAIAAILVLLIAAVEFISFIRGDSGKVFSNVLGKNDVFRVGEAVCTVPEMTVYLTTTQLEYESVYSAKIWDTVSEGVTLEENVKQTVLEKAAQIKSMYLLAKSREISIEKEEQEQIKAAAKEYMGRLGKEKAEALGITDDLLQKMFEEYLMANKVYQSIICEVNPEISDDEARIITVQHILIKTYTKDAEGNRVDFLTADKQAAFEEISRIREEVTEGEKTFEELAAKYSQDGNLSYSFGMGEMDPAFEAAAFQLATDEVSPVTESESGYHIIKCISTFDREETEENKKRLLEERRNKTFGLEYEAFVENLSRKINQSVWNGMGLLHDGTLPTVDFFEIYRSHFE